MQSASITLSLEMFDNIDSIPKRCLLWFHFVSWDFEMESERTLWDEFVRRSLEGDFTEVFSRR